MLDDVGEATDAGRTVARVEGAVDEALNSSMIGRRVRGAVLSGESTKTLQQYYLSRKLDILTNQDAILDTLKSNGSFRPFSDGSATIRLRANATQYEALHELAHWEHMTEIGSQRYMDLLKTKEGNLILEQEAYNRLRRPEIWSMLSGGERAHARWYIKEKLGGDAW